MADYMRETLGDAYINNAGQIRWIDGEEAVNVPEGYYECANTDDDYNFDIIEDMAETMDLCCFEVQGGTDDQALLSVIIGVHDFYLNVLTHQLLSHDKQYNIGEKNEAVPIYEHQCRVKLWIPDV